MVFWIKKILSRLLQNWYYEIVEIFVFFEGLTYIPVILVKNLKILSNLFLFQKGLDMMFDGVLGKKRCL